MIFDYSKLFAGISIPCIIVLPDSPNYSIVDVNEAYCELSGKYREQMLGAGFFEVFPSTDFIDIQDWEKIFEPVLQKKKMVREGVRTWVDPERGGISHNTIKYFEIAQFPVLDDRGEIVVIVRSLVDVTSNVVERNLLDEAQTAVKFGNWWIDLERVSMKWSSGIKEIFGVGQDFEPDFDNVRELYWDPADEERFLGDISRSIRENQILKSHFTVRTASGEIKRIKVLGKPDHESGSCTGIHGIAIDVTQEYNDKMRMEEIYFKQNHDFRAPLARIIGIAELLRIESCQDSSAKSLVDAILTSAYEMDSVIKDIVNIFHGGKR